MVSVKREGQSATGAETVNRCCCTHVSHHSANITPFKQDPIRSILGTPPWANPWASVTRNSRRRLTHNLNQEICHAYRLRTKARAGPLYISKNKWINSTQERYQYHRPNNKRTQTQHHGPRIRICDGGAHNPAALEYNSSGTTYFQQLMNKIEHRAL